MGAQAVDWEFVYIICFPLASLGCLWAAFGLLWADCGLPLAPLGVPFLGLPVAVLSFPLVVLGASGASSGFDAIVNVTFRANMSNVPRLRKKSNLPELSPQSPGSPGSGYGTQLATPLPRAGG